MSAWLDSYSGAGYDGSESGGIGDTGLEILQGASNNAGSAGYVSGFLQSLASVGTGYLNKRLDIDLYQRAQEAVQPQLRTTQNGIFVRRQAPQPGGIGGQELPLLNLSAVLPYLIVGGLVFLVATAGRG